MFKKKKIEEVVPETIETPSEVKADVDVVSSIVAEESTSLAVESIPAGARYNGSLVIEKLEEVTGDGRLCRLEDGTTAYVPLAILGEENA